MASNDSAVPARLQQFDSLPDSAHVQLRVVAALVGVSDATVWRMVKRGALPAPKKVSARATRWNVGELRQTLAACTAAPSAGDVKLLGST